MKRTSARTPPPPPLKLLHDNTIPESERRPIPCPCPQPLPPCAQWRLEKFVRRLYKSDWRTVVIAVAAFNALRFIFSATDVFEHITPDTVYYFPRLARISAVLTCIYLAISFIQAFGVASLCFKRLILIRIYTYLSFISALLLISAGFITSLSFLLLGEDLVIECVTSSFVDGHQTTAFFRGTRIFHKTKAVLAPRHSLLIAYRQCTKAYTHPQTPPPLLPVTLFLFTLLPSALFCFLAYTYYKQVTDPTHPASLFCSRSDSKLERGSATTALLESGTDASLQCETATNSIACTHLTLSRLSYEVTPRPRHA